MESRDTHGEIFVTRSGIIIKEKEKKKNINTRVYTGKKKRMCKMKCVTIPVTIAGTGIVTKILKNN